LLKASKRFYLRVFKEVYVAKKNQIVTTHPGNSLSNLNWPIELRYESLLKQAAIEPEPIEALAIFQQVADGCQGAIAKIAFESEPKPVAVCSAGKIYLDALLGIASSQWKLNREDQAISVLKEMLILDPQDSRFARYWLAASLLGQGKFDEVGLLMANLDQRSEHVRYIQALQTFATHGDSESARSHLREAYRTNRKFIDFVLGGAQISTGKPVQFDSDVSMHSFARLILPAWRTVPGSLSWTRQVLRYFPSNESAKKKVALPFPRQQLTALQRSAATWQVCISPLKQDSKDNDAGWILGIGDTKKEGLRNITFFEQQPTTAQVWSEIMKAMLKPFQGEPSRPSCIDVARPEIRKALQRMLREMDCECQVVYRMPQFQALIDGMDQIMAIKSSQKYDVDFEPTDLPCSDAVWQIAFFLHPMIIEDSKQGSCRLQSVMTIDCQTEIVLGSDFVEGQPHPDLLWKSALKHMQNNSVRPRRIELTDSSVYDSLKDRITRAGIECVLRDELPVLNKFLMDLVNSLEEPEKCSVADGVDVDYDAMESFYHAAAQYFRQAPWRKVTGDLPIRVVLPNGDRRAAIVMGRSGMTLGLSLHDRAEDVQAMMLGKLSADELLASSVVFDEQRIAAPKDLYLIERFGWPIATLDAYPAVMRMRPGHNPTSPSKKELEILEGLMRCIPQFITSGEQSAVYSSDITGLSSNLSLSWMVDRRRW